MALSTRALVLPRIFAASSGKRWASVATMRNSAAASGSQARPVMVSPMVDQSVPQVHALELGRGQHRLHVALHQPGDDRSQQIPLVLEALVDRAGRYPGLVRHLVDAGAAVAVAQEHPRGGRDERVGARRFRAAARPTHPVGGRKAFRMRFIEARWGRGVWQCSPMENDMCRFPVQELFACVTFIWIKYSSLNC